MGNNLKSCLENSHIKKQKISIFFDDYHYIMMQSNLQPECQTRATRVRHEQQKCDTSAMQVTRVRHEWLECDTSATQMTQVRHEWKILILITTRVKTYFHTSIFIIWQVKDNKERNNFILRTFIWKSFVPMPKCV